LNKMCHPIDTHCAVVCQSKASQIHNLEVEMLNYWLRKPNLVAYLFLVTALLAALVCGAAEQPTQAPPATAAPVATSAPSPTAVPQAIEPPSDGMVAGAEYAPTFAEYWKPPVEFYGQPVKGGTMRYIYEDPLEHANAWGASAGPADRMRVFTANHIVSEDPYESGQIVPDLARGWTQKADATGITFSFHDNIKGTRERILSVRMPGLLSRPGLPAMASPPAPRKATWLSLT
jgi:hypothetical protein